MREHNHHHHHHGGPDRGSAVDHDHDCAGPGDRAERSGERPGFRGRRGPGGRGPWGGPDGGGREDDALHAEFRHLRGAVRGLTHTGTAEQRTEAQHLLSEARRRIYLLLAGGPDAASTATEAGSATGDAG